MDTVANAVGGPINALIIASLITNVVIGCAIASTGIWLYGLYQNKTAERKAEAVREAEALIGADAMPWTVLQATDILSGIDDVKNLCLLGAPVDFVEDLFSDLRCSNPCEEHSRCQLAN